MNTEEKSVVTDVENLSDVQKALSELQYFSENCGLLPAVTSISLTGLYAYSSVNQAEKLKVLLNFGMKPETNWKDRNYVTFSKTIGKVSIFCSVEKTIFAKENRVLEINAEFSDFSDEFNPVPSEAKSK